MTGNLDPANPGDIRRAPTGAMDDEDDFVLDDEEDFHPSAAMFSGRNDEDHVRRLFEKDVEDARTFFQSKPFKTEAERKELMDFVDARQSEWHRTTWEGRNFLHHLAYYDSSRQPFVPLRWLMARAICRLPTLMSVMDKSKRTPLTVSLSLGNEMFTRSACRNQLPKTLRHITTALRSECQDHDNDRDVTCLHSALTCEFTEEKSREETIKIICSFVPEEMFTVTDFKGRTPLHLAVEYDRCCTTQVRIVAELLKRGSKALNVGITSHGNRSLSVYQYHENSRKQAEARKKSLTAQQKKPAPSTGKNRKDGLTESDAAAKDEAKRAAPKKEKMNMGPPTSAKDTAEFVPPGIQRRDSAMQSETPKGTKTSSSGPANPDSGSSTAPGQRIVALPSATDRALREAEQDLAAREIGERLKLIYLRTLRPDLVAHSLHLQDDRGAHTVITLHFVIAYDSQIGSYGLTLVPALKRS
ncbi:intracellular serine protease [Colletotrichum tofieldiae]|nr:intracellular serine protease [Colletotrichum tofieldiae]GKT74000.1 intracellular serine protease [Colletotrichum tofieldiae]